MKPRYMNRNSCPHRSLPQLLVIEKIGDRNDLSFCSDEPIEPRSPTYLKEFASAQSPKAINCAQEEDLGKFLKWAFERINEHGKQYLATESINAKMASYKQATKQEFDNASNIPHSSSSTGLCQHQSRMSSSAFKRYPLVSRRSDESAHQQALNRPRSCQRITTQPVRPLKHFHNHIRPMSAEDPLQSSANEHPAVFNPSSTTDIALNGTCILQPHRFLVMNTRAPAYEGKSSLSLARAALAESGTAHDTVHQSSVCGRGMIVKQLIEPHENRRSVTPLFRRSAAEIAAKRAAVINSGALHYGEAPRLDEAEQPSAAAPAAAAAPPADDPAGLGPPPLPVAAAAAASGGGEARRSVVVRVLHGGLAPDC